jgi:hypothetical protein
MLASLVAAILYLASYPSYLFAGPSNADTIGQAVIDAAQAHDVDPYLLIALLSHESDFLPQARSKVGAWGIAQLHPGYWGRDAKRKCNASPGLCTWWSVWYGAIALRHYQRTCGSEAKAITAYRVGHCSGVGPKARQVLRTRALIRRKFPANGWGVQVGEAVLL